MFVGQQFIFTYFIWRFSALLTIYLRKILLRENTALNYILINGLSKVRLTVIGYIRAITLLITLWDFKWFVSFGCVFGHVKNLIWVRGRIWSVLWSGDQPDSTWYSLQRSWLNLSSIQCLVREIFYWHTTYNVRHTQTQNGFTYEPRFPCVYLAEFEEFIREMVVRFIDLPSSLLWVAHLHLLYTRKQQKKLSFRRHYFVQWCLFVQK